MMVEFVHDARGLLREACRLLAPGGLLSLVDTNRYSEPYVKAFPPGGGNLADALKAVGTREYFHPWVNRLTPRFSAEEFIGQLRPSGCALAGHYGIACLCWYLPNERKSDPRYFAELEELEHRLTDAYPYYLLARFFQIVARKE
jgi:S-adenosylmethionine-dependent methyltransferase